MLRVKCVNKAPSIGEHYFEFDEVAIGTELPESNDRINVKSFLITCPKCGALNKIKLKERPETSKGYGMGVALVKQPIDFR